MHGGDETAVGGVDEAREKMGGEARVGEDRHGEGTKGSTAADVQVAAQGRIQICSRNWAIGWIEGWDAKVRLWDGGELRFMVVWLR